MRVLLVDDLPCVRTWTRIASRFPHLELVGLTNALEAESTLQRAHFDALCVEEMMPSLRGTDLAARIRPMCPDVGIVLFTAAVDMDIARRALDGGVDCFLPKPFEPDDLIEAATRAHQRRKHGELLARIARAVQSFIEQPQAARTVHPFERRLSAAEREVFELCLAGASLKEMASARSVALDTIKKQAQAVYQKVGVGSKKEIWQRWGRGATTAGVRAGPKNTH